MFYAISGINGDYEAYKRALAKLKFQNLDDIKEEDIMNEDAVINTLEGVRMYCMLSATLSELAAVL